MKKLILLFLLMPAAGFAQRNAALNHVALSVYDLKKSTTFYRDILKLDTIPEPFHDGKHTWLKIAPTSALHLIQSATSITQHDKGTHICFSVPSVDAFIERLNKHHIDFTNWQGTGKTPTVRVDGVKQIYLTDPDGYWLEINDDHAALPAS